MEASTGRGRHRKAGGRPAKALALPDEGHNAASCAASGESNERRVGRPEMKMNAYRKMTENW